MGLNDNLKQGQTFFNLVRLEVLRAEIPALEPFVCKFQGVDIHHVQVEVELVVEATMSFGVASGRRARRGQTFLGLV